MKKINKQACIILLGYVVITIILGLCTKPKDNESSKQVMGAALKDQTAAWLREQFPDQLIITTQEQLDSLIEDANHRIATSPTPEDYLHRGSLFFAGQDYEAALLDMDAGLALLPPGDTSELKTKLLFGKASCYKGTGNKEQEIATYKEILSYDSSNQEAIECLALANPR